MNGFRKFMEMPWDRLEPKFTEPDETRAQSFKKKVADRNDKPDTSQVGFFNQPVSRQQVSGVFMPHDVSRYKDPKTAEKMKSQFDKFQNNIEDEDLHLVKTIKGIKIYFLAIEPRHKMLQGVRPHIRIQARVAVNNTIGYPLPKDTIVHVKEGSTGHPASNWFDWHSLAHAIMTYDGMDINFDIIKELYEIMLRVTQEHLYKFGEDAPYISYGDMFQNGNPQSFQTIKMVMSRLLPFKSARTESGLFYDHPLANDAGKEPNSKESKKISQKSANEVGVLQELIYEMFAEFITKGKVVLAPEHEGRTDHGKKSISYKNYLKMAKWFKDKDRNVPHWEAFDSIEIEQETLDKFAKRIQTLFLKALANKAGCIVFHWSEPGSDNKSDCGDEKLPDWSKST